MNELYALKGNIIYSKNQIELITIPNGYVVCKDGHSLGAFAKLPKQWEKIYVIDYKDALIIPGLVDLHTHAPQFVFRALNLDKELLEWLNINTFPQEARYESEEHAREAYQMVVEDIVAGPNTRLNLFATLHVPGTIILMELLEKAGIIANVGKVNMDRNSPDILREKSAEESIEQTIAWLDTIQGRFTRVRPILTPRFIPSCSDALMEGLGRIRTEYQLPVQSHLSENLSEIEWVKELCKESTCYGDAYDRFGMFGNGTPTVMAHCVHCPDHELELMKKNEVFIAHCAQSNTNLSSGIAPVRKYIDMGLKMGLGSDVAGGYTTSIFRAMADSLQASKLYWRLIDTNSKPLTLEESFYLATLGGGEFFGRVGSFEEGYEFDAVIVDDSRYNRLMSLTLKERLERAVFLSDDRHIAAKYVAGNKVK